ncbi:dihydroorotate dehydrogenase electron transfer subunit [Candidatus Micrarchaeota archaeon]|nr:dihydroorotate dehydrogenase electron transfer subunit [Candidatus Micrarchaeota archaeon]
MNRQTFRVKKVIEESQEVKTFVLDGSIEADAGQFFMLWVPGVNEKPFCFADNDPFTFTVCNVGPFSSKVHELKEGELVTVLGPLGKGYGIGNEERILLVGGGYGTVSLYLLAKQAKGKKIDVIIGAKSKEDVSYKKRFEELGCRVFVTTDDGSEGVKGYAVDGMKELLRENKYDKVYTCGPMIMMKTICGLAKEKGIQFEASLEANMKCGIGICGSCAIKDKIVCKDGPVFANEEAAYLLDI